MVDQVVERCKTFAFLVEEEALVGSSNSRMSDFSADEA